MEWQVFPIADIRCHDSRKSCSLAETCISNACGKNSLRYPAVGVKDLLCTFNYLLILLLSDCKIEMLFYSD